MNTCIHIHQTELFWKMLQQMEIEKCGVHRAAGGICMYRSATLSADVLVSFWESGARACFFKCCLLPSTALQVYGYHSHQFNTIVCQSLHVYI